MLRPRREPGRSPAWRAGQVHRRSMHCRTPRSGTASWPREPRDRAVWWPNDRGTPSASFYGEPRATSAERNAPLAGQLARGTPAGELLHGAAEGLHVLMDVEHFVTADGAFARCFRQAVRVLGLLEQQDGDEADAAVRAGHFNRAVPVRFIQQFDLAIRQCLRAGEALVVFGPLLDQRDQVHYFPL